MRTCPSTDTAAADPCRPPTTLTAGGPAWPWTRSNSYAGLRVLLPVLSVAACSGGAGRRHGAHRRGGSAAPDGCPTRFCLLSASWSQAGQCWTIIGLPRWQWQDCLHNPSHTVCHPLRPPSSTGAHKAYASSGEQGSGTLFWQGCYGYGLPRWPAVHRVGLQIPHSPFFCHSFTGAHSNNRCVFTRHSRVAGSGSV